MTDTLFSPALIHFHSDGSSQKDEKFLLSFGDTITVSKKEKGISIHSEGDIKIPTNSDNSVYQIVKDFLQCLKSKNKEKIGFSIHIHKKIPVHSGLSGSSSNAAILILYLHSLYNEFVTFDVINDRILSKYPRVSFFVDVYKKIASCKKRASNMKVLLIFPRNIIIPSDWVKAEMVKTGDIDENDFIFQKYPDLLSIKNKILTFDPNFAGITGTGSTVFGVFSSKKGVLELKQSLFSYGVVEECATLIS